MRKIYTILLVMVSSGLALAQNSLSGTVVGGTEQEPLINATVKVTGTDLVGLTNTMGQFTINNVPSGSQTARISYFGYTEKAVTVNVNGSTSMGIVALESSPVGLQEVVVSGVIDLVRDRQTPIAVSTVRASEIRQKLGNQEFPEILRFTPSVYATKTSGGYGDGRINVRGFDQRNTAVIINGQPVNDMENGWVYWSNWSGLQDMANGIEVQRGLGASNLAVPSVGGTINIVTKSTLARQGGYVLAGLGNDGFLKTTVAYNTGVNDNGWSASFLLGRWQGDGYINGTQGAGWNYSVGLGYMFSEWNSVNFQLIGAGQWHHQRDARISIRDYRNFGEADKDGINRKLNLDWGMLDGEEYSYRRNFYNKPIASLNWDWNITSDVRLFTTLYGSWGRGGGTGPRGQNFGIYPFNKDLTQAMADGDLPYRNTDGTIDVDAVVANNRSGTPYNGPIDEFDGLIIGSNGYNQDGVNNNASIRRSSVNSHNWYGAISNLEFDVNDFTFGVGVDLRSYRGLHYRVLNDLLGLDGYYSTGNDFSEGQIVTSTSAADPFRNISESAKIDYYNIGEVNWGGVNGLAEYNTDRFNAVLQGGVSMQSYRRIDYFDQYPHASDLHTINGGYVKGGANFNLNDHHNVFANAGYIARPPFFDAVFPNFANGINDDVEAEKITSFELGYGYRSSYLDLNANGYYTTWTNRFISQSVQLPGGNEGTAVFSGIENVHTGVELEAVIKPMEGLRVRAMGSLGNWTYAGETTANVFDNNQNQIGTKTLYIDGVRVGDAAQTTLSLGVDYTITSGLSVDAAYHYFDQLYADFSVLDSEFDNADNNGALQLPSYGLLDLGVTYTIGLGGKQKLLARFNVNNLLNELYIAESETNIHGVENGYDTWNGISTQNSVWFGFGTTWNFSVKYSF